MNPAEARALAETLMRKHLDEKGRPGWTFRWGKGKRTLGTCEYGPKRIALSKAYVELNPVERVRDTILHEIAHALTPGHGHDATWKAACRAIGAKPERYADASQVVVPPSLYVATCSGCGTEVGRDRKTTRNLCCRRCYERAGDVRRLVFRRRA